MREPGIPKNWSGKFANIGNKKQTPKIPSANHTGSHLLPNNSGSPHQQKIESESQEFLQMRDRQQPITQSSINTSYDASSIPPRIQPPIPPVHKLPGWLRNWLVWAVLAGVTTTGVGVVAIAFLLKLPAAPNCPAVFWPLATATVRLHCAEVAANKQTVKDLLAAIHLVQALPEDHPLHGEINTSIAQWTQDILDIGDRSFQAGKLPSAIAIAKEIPKNVPNYQIVEKQIATWEATWAQAEEIYKEVEAQLPKRHWHDAFMAAVRLLNIGNEYWATTKYEQLNQLIETAKEDANNIDKAQILAKRSNLNDLLAAIKIAESLGSSSYSYQDAQALIPEIGRTMIALAQDALDRKDADEAIAIASQIPASTDMQAEANDLVTIAQAWRSAWQDSIPGLENAIATAQKVTSDRPAYNQAQALIARWQLEIEDVANLQKARELAKGGTVGDLTAAIAQAEVVSDNNPRGEEANTEISRWRSKVETIEDRPYLARAEELATMADVGSLQAAINEASQINRGRSLYREARRKISNWRGQIERIEDQPILESARSFASNGNLPAAIGTARQIQSGRSLSGEAQAAIDDWQAQIDARQNWREARQIALQGTPESLARAIRIANRVPRSSPLRFDVNQATAEWSNRILNTAVDRGQSDILGGIAIAKLVPRNSEAYRAAQEQIATWERFLNPPQPESPAPENPEPEN
ncbi:hypothetical protein [Aliterella atlantica]|uniref:hypothetical protein n=1 Tax=Aliterella atlantica TaxID=1827278 RepID=UPI0005D3D84B|nr:hypothetical protein [Aliterella atlantica]